MGDDALQKEGGDAIWNSVTHALKPGAIRCVPLPTTCNDMTYHDVISYDMTTCTLVRVG